MWRMLEFSAFMDALFEVLLILSSFAFLALAAKQVGDYFARYDLPLITGFLVAGVLIGPYALGLLKAEELEKLRFVDELALAFIAFAAGAELYLPELRHRLRAVTWVTLMQVAATLTLGIWAGLYLLRQLPGAGGLGAGALWGLALLLAVILIARSPSSTIAVIHELKAKGPFTQLVLGVTVVTDVVVITLFAIALALARAAYFGRPLDLGFLLLLAAEIAVSLLLAYGLFRLLLFVLRAHLPPWAKAGAVLILGYGLFFLEHEFEALSHGVFGYEPLLSGMLAAFALVNLSPYRDEFDRLLAGLGPAVYIAFFTLVGAELKLDVLVSAWALGLAFFLVRLLGVFLGSFLGGVLAGEPLSRAALSGLAFVTQAGVALGLVRKVADTFPAVGEGMATLVVALVILNQLVGPPLFKWALRRVGEARAGVRVRRVLVFGDDDQAQALARRLSAEGFRVQLFAHEPERLTDAGVEVRPLDLDALPEADRVLGLLTDEENLVLCERYGERAVLRHQGRLPLERFSGCRVINPAVATLELLARFVESPGAAALLLGLEAGQAVRDFEVADPALDGVPLRELRLPADVLILAIHRGEEAIVTHGYTQLKLGDRVTAMGGPESLVELERLFSA